MKALAPVKSVVYHSPSPKDVFAYSPGICALDSGRLVATMDAGGPGVVRYFEKAVSSGGDFYECGQVFLSDDRGETWKKTAEFPYYHARPFAAGKSLYVLGHAGDLRIIRSDDGGETWSEPYFLTHGEAWHQAPANVWYANGRVYLVMEKLSEEPRPGWPVSALLPVLLSANVNDDLTRRENWRFAEAKAFRDLMKEEETDYFGIPFYRTDPLEGAMIGGDRYCAPLGWLETNVVQFTDPAHLWCDPSGHTFHLFMRAHTGRTGYAAMAKVTELPDGKTEFSLEKAPSGKTLLYLPMPGGQMKFHILYDEKTALYWLLSTQATDSMIRPEAMPADRYNLPDNERQRLQLHFSKNCVDWCFAGLVDMGETTGQSRHYASMCILGDDLYILSRSGDSEAATPHNTDMITLHEVKDFRTLVY